MVDWAEDKLPACHEGKRLPSENLEKSQAGMPMPPWEGYLPSGAPDGEMVVISKLWSGILGNVHTEPGTWAQIRSIR